MGFFDSPAEPSSLVGGLGLFDSWIRNFAHGLLGVVEDFFALPGCNEKLIQGDSDVDSRFISHSSRNMAPAGQIFC
jgi:hypothetical protein